MKVFKNLESPHVVDLIKYTIFPADDYYNSWKVKERNADKYVASLLSTALELVEAAFLFISLTTVFIPFIYIADFNKVAAELIGYTACHFNSESLSLAIIV